MSQENPRTLEQVNEVLTLAKLTEEDIMPTSQAIYFTDNIYDNNYKFLQLDAHLMSEIKEGQTLFIKGADDEEVVICSETKTYNVLEAETSNSLLLVDGLKFTEDVKNTAERGINKVRVYGIFFDYLEAVAAKPHLKKLRNMLEGGIYKGPEHEYSVKSENLLSITDLNRVIQASNKEIDDAIALMDVVEINNKIRLLDFEYHFRVLSFMLKLIDENSWQLDHIEYEETANSLSDLVPTEIVNVLFDKYTTESKIIDGVQLYKYKEDKVCTFFAQVLLKSAGKFNLNEFLQAWKDSVPEGMVPQEEMLYGIAIIDRKSNPNVIRAFDEENLSENIMERLNALFEVKEKWSVPEITPYIKRLATEKVDANALLAKYARASKQNDVKYYSAKHAK
ncbi:unnamed protein product [Brassicogethes aeneus]|uniref:Sister chromatid cohesion protein DCC1 n=1 Tax=Brassicogethes aeneus TaxID=1431903 RepID=A0A9P0AZN4_BRAAE|nr:unnamed protein product [Brassicogethes aeneus]